MALQTPPTISSWRVKNTKILAFLDAQGPGLLVFDADVLEALESDGIANAYVVQALLIRGRDNFALRPLLNAHLTSLLIEESHELSCLQRERRPSSSS
jgi:hypothetical protein